LLSYSIVNNFKLITRSKNLQQNPGKIPKLMKLHRLIEFLTHIMPYAIIVVTYQILEAF